MWQSQEKAILWGLLVSIFLHGLLWGFFAVNNIQSPFPDKFISIEFEEEEKKEEIISPKEKELTALEKELNQLSKIINTNKASNNDKTNKKSALETFKEKLQSLNKVSLSNKSQIFEKDASQKMFDAHKYKPQKDSLTNSQTQKLLGEIGLKEKSYTGESRVNYFLKGRYATLLPIPVFTSEKGGVIQIDIEVDNFGIVFKTSFNKAKSTLQQTNTIQTALNYAKKSYFSKSDSSFQQGYIRYNFVAQ